MKMLRVAAFVLALAVMLAWLGLGDARALAGVSPVPLPNVSPLDPPVWVMCDGQGTGVEMGEWEDQNGNSGWRLMRW